MIISRKEARIGSGNDVYRFVLKNGVYVADAVRSVSSALVTTVSETRDIMEYNCFLA